MIISLLIISLRMFVSESAAEDLRNRVAHGRSLFVFVAVLAVSCLFT